MVLALAITVNLILTGPMYSMVTLATGGGKVSEENVASATQLCEDLADEGIVLLDNDGTLPMAKNSKLNVFGWASTNPCYGGTGSGALSDAYPTVTLVRVERESLWELAKTYHSSVEQIRAMNELDEDFSGRLLLIPKAL